MKQTLKLKWLIVGAFLSSIGTSFIWPLTTIYLHNELHRSLTVIVVRFYRIKREKGHQKQQQAAQRVRIKPANLKIMWTFFISLTIIWVMYEQWVSNMSVYITDQGISMPLYSMLWTINASLIVVMQLFMSWANQRIKNVYLPVYVGALFCGASFIILIWAHRYWIFLVAMIILTVGEATAFPAIPAIVNDLLRWR